MWRWVQRRRPAASGFSKIRHGLHERRHGCRGATAPLLMKDWCAEESGQIREKTERKGEEEEEERKGEKTQPRVVKEREMIEEGREQEEEEEGESWFR